MKIRFQADADLNQIIVRATLRLEPAIDFQTAHAAGLFVPIELPKAAERVLMAASD